MTKSFFKFATDFLANCRISPFVLVFYLKNRPNLIRFNVYIEKSFDATFNIGLLKSPMHVDGLKNKLKIEYLNEIN